VANPTQGGGLLDRGCSSAARGEAGTILTVARHRDRRDSGFPTGGSNVQDGRAEKPLRYAEYWVDFNQFKHVMKCVFDMLDRAALRLMGAVVLPRHPRTPL
jgi:hypothetical protein